MDNLSIKVWESWKRNNGNGEAVAQEFKTLNNIQYSTVLNLIEQLENK